MLQNNETDKAIDNLKPGPDPESQVWRSPSVAGRNPDPDWKCRARDYFPETARSTAASHRARPICARGRLIAPKASLDSAIQIYRELEKAYPTNAQLSPAAGNTLPSKKNNAGARVGI